MKLRLSSSTFIAAIAPIIATLAGALATWLLVHVHFLTLFHVTHDALAAAIAEATIFGVTAGGTFLIHHTYLKHALALQASARAVEAQAKLYGPTSAGR